ncbi:hypothetical protein ACJX0J_039174, partial [Zea mays]
MSISLCAPPHLSLGEKQHLDWLNDFTTKGPDCNELPRNQILHFATLLPAASTLLLILKHFLEIGYNGAELQLSIFVTQCGMDAVFKSTGDLQYAAVDLCTAHARDMAIKT